MKKPKFLIKSMLIAATGVAICIFAAQYYFEYNAPGNRYKRTKATSDLREALAYCVEPGATRDEVARHIGRGKLRDVDYVEQFIELEPKGYYPPGTFRKGDRIVHYPTDGGVNYGLLFRNDRLIGFDPKDYETPDNVITSLSGG